MGITDFLSGLKNKHYSKSYAKMLNGQMPVFSSFGEDIYASDVVRSCARCVATEMSKLSPKHIRVDTEDKQTAVNSSINRLLKCAPNPLMTTKDFLEKITWLRELNYNAFIYPTYDMMSDSDGIKKRNYTGFYPLNPTGVEYLEDGAGQLFIKMSFNNGECYTLPYDNIIHWRKDFSVNDFMGGNALGQPNTDVLLRTLKINDTLVQGLEKGMKLSMGIRALYKVSTLMGDEKMAKELANFEQKVTSGDSAILPLDMKGDFIPINIDPKMVDKDTLEFLDKKVLNHFGVSMPILTGDFTDEQYQAFYEKRLEPDIIGLGQAFTKTLFTKRELETGNEVIFYSQQLLFTNTKNRIAVADILGSRGALTDNQLLGLFGYPPFEGGDIRRVSLNYINREIADQYQMNRVVGTKGVAEDGKQDDQ